MSADYRFSEQELERVLKSLQAQQAALDRRIEETSAARSRTLAERDQVRSTLGSLPPARTVDEVRRHAELQARLEAANTTLEALRTEQSALTTLRGLAAARDRSLAPALHRAERSATRRRGARPRRR